MVVALLAFQARVLAFENVSRFSMVESLGVPLHQRKIFAVVFGVTARAFLARTRRNVIGGV